MKKLSVTALLLLLFAACSAPREPEQQIAAPPQGSEAWCELYSAAMPDGFDGDVPYEEDAPYFAGPRLTFRDPYFTPADPLREESTRRCLREEQPG